jgi:hypothetical protein
VDAVILPASLRRRLTHDERRLAAALASVRKAVNR